MDIIIKKSPLERRQKFMHPRTRQEYEQELADITTQLEDPFLARQLSDSGQATLRTDKRRIAAVLERTNPGQLSEVDKDAIVARIKEIDAQVKEGMPSYEQQMTKPPGAVKAHMDWEKRNKDLILERKSLQYALHPDEVDNPDLGNIEVLRKRGKITQRTAAVGATPKARGRPPKRRVAE